MKRRFESGASKRRRKQLYDSAAKSSTRITSFLQPKLVEALQAQNGDTIALGHVATCSRDDASTRQLPPTTSLMADDISVYEHDEQHCHAHVRDEIQVNEFNEATVTQMAYAEQPEQDLMPTTASTTAITNLTSTDIGMIDKRNTAQIQSFLKIKCFEIPSNIPRDAANHAFPSRLLSKTLPNGEVCKRDWLCWSTAKESLYCAPCFTLSKGTSNTVLSNKSGWCRTRGWRKLKDRIPKHEHSISHKENYVTWKSASKSASSKSSIDDLLLSELKVETNMWKNLLERILNIILFLSERGLALFGSTQRIGDCTNGNFLGIVELLGKYDTLMSDHVKRVRESQESQQRMQVHYLSQRIQNEFIEICGSFVQTSIIGEIRNAKYFSIIVDATPDCSHKEQTTLVIRYVKIDDNSDFSIEERFILFDDFNRKTGQEIADRILQLLDGLQLDFQVCVGQAYDNGSNMAGKYKGVQAVLLQHNSNCIFSSCGNHTLNLVGVDCAESCKEAMTYFGTIQQMYNLFSCSPRRWEILKQYLPVSLQGMSKTRWSARIDGVRPVAQHLDALIKALSGLESLNLTAQTRTELKSIQKYMTKFECILMSSLWIKLLTAIHQTNIIIESRSSTLDVERDNVENLIGFIEKIREQWHEILAESKLVSQNIGICPVFSTSRSLPTDADVEQHYKVNVFFVIIDSILSGLVRRFEALQQICAFFGFLWQFNTLTDEDLHSAAEQFHQRYHTEVSEDLCDEVIFFRRIYSTNFHVQSKPKDLLQEIIKLGLSGVFPNVTIALRIFLCLPASVASGERSFNVLKQVKNYHRSTMGQERLNGLAMLNINCDIARKLDFSAVISAFAHKKARKAHFK